MQEKPKGNFPDYPDPLSRKYYSNSTVKDNTKVPTPTVKWDDNIKNPANKEFVDEVKFNKKNNSKVTQQEFNQRYKIK